MTAPMVVEFARFKVQDGITDAEFLKVSAAFESDFLSQQAGYVRRDVLRGEGQVWVDLLYWESKEAAEAVFAAAQNNPAAGAYFSKMADLDNGGADVSYYHCLKSWKK